MENLQPIEDYLRKGEYPEKKQRRQTLEENADKTSSLKMAAFTIRRTPKLLVRTGGCVCVALRRNQESSRIAMQV